MRVTLLSFDDTPPLGGQGVLLRDMRAAIQGRGVEVTTISGRGDHAISYRRILHRAPLDFSLHLNRHPEEISRTHPEVVHLLGGPGGVLLTRKLTQPIVVTANHTYRQAHPKRSPRRALSKLEARCYGNAARILAISASTADVIRQMGISSDRVEVLAPGVPVPPRLRPEDRVPGRLLFVGRLEAEKGVLDALFVMQQLIASDSSFSGHIIGTGRLVEQVIRTCASTPRLEYLGSVDDARLAGEYAAAEIVLMPSAYEGLGLVALEAMAAGAVVCGYDVDGLRDAALGVAPMVPRGSREDLAAVAKAVHDDPVRLADLSGRGREAVIRHHSWEHYADRLIEVYSEIRAT